MYVPIIVVIIKYTEYDGKEKKKVVKGGGGSRERCEICPPPVLCTYPISNSLGAR